MSREFAFAILALCNIPSNLVCAPTYTITSVYELPAGDQTLDIGGINNAGVVVGDVTVIGRTGNGWMYDSGSISYLSYCRFPGGVNTQGQIVGRRASMFISEAVICSSDGTYSDIPRLAQPDPNHVAGAAGLAINNSGVAVGATPNPDGILHAFLYKGGAVSDLGTFGSGASFAYGINDSEQVVGAASADQAYVYHAFLYDGGVMSDLGTLGGSRSWALGINNLGQIVGYSELAGGGTHAFLYDNGVMMDLGSLGGGNSQALAINDAGQIVGNSNGHAFVLVDGTMWDLNDLIPASSGWVLYTATAINSSGQIIGLGMYNGVLNAYLATPDNP